MILALIPGGKYALYIWPAYGASVIAFVWMTLDTLLRARRWRRKAEALEQGQDDRGRPLRPSR